jgi:hypothetical protein
MFKTVLLTLSRCLKLFSLHCPDVKSCSPYLGFTCLATRPGIGGIIDTSDLKIHMLHSKHSPDWKGTYKGNRILLKRRLTVISGLSWQSAGYEKGIGFATSLGPDVCMGI